MSLSAVPGTARTVPVRFSLGFQLVQMAPAARQAVVDLWLQPFSPLWVVHCCLWWCFACLSVLAALPSLSTRVHTPGLRGVARPRLRSSCPRGTDHLGGSTIGHDETTWKRAVDIGNGNKRFYAVVPGGNANCPVACPHNHDKATACEYHHLNK